MGLVSIFATLVTLMGATPPPATQPTTAPVSKPTATQPAGDRVVRVLDALEAKGDEVRDLRCRVFYTVHDIVGMDEFTKFGTIVYKRGKPNPLFAITFTKTHQGGYVLRQQEWYLFADRWFYEAKERSKTVIKREVIRAGEVIDLFSLEKSPFPIPFGQRKDEILKHFDVTLVAAEADDPKDTDHLRCIPKAGSRMADEYSSLEFFVSRSLHLPIKIIATESDPDGQPAKIITALFPDLSPDGINSGVPDGEFRLPAETSAFQLIVEPLDEPGGSAKP